MAEDEEIKTHSFFKRIDWAKLEAREVQPPIIPKLVKISFLKGDFCNLIFDDVLLMKFTKKL